MLVPLENNIGLTSISLSLIYFLKKQAIINNSFKPFFYFSLKSNFLDSTQFIIKKYFSKFVHTLDDQNLFKQKMHSYKYLSLSDQIFKECYSKSLLYEVFLIEGMNYIENQYSFQINYDLSKNLDSEIIFISNLKKLSLNSMKEKEKEIEILCKLYKHSNVLGVIYNNIFSSFREKNNFFDKLLCPKYTQKCKIYKIFKKNYFKKSSVPILSCIPWNNKLVKISIIDVFNFLNLNALYKKPINNWILKEVVLFETNCWSLLSKNNLSFSLIILNINIIDVFINFFNSKNIKICIGGILLTEVSKSKETKNFLFKKFKNICATIFFTKKNTMDIFEKLKSFTFNINMKSKSSIHKIQKYFSSFFYHDFFRNFFIKKKYNNLKYSPKKFCFFLEKLSKNSKKRIILPESYDTRILKAVSICHESRVAKCVLLGQPETIYRISEEQGINLNREIEILNPDLIRYKYISRLIEIRKNKGISKYSAINQLKNNTILATLILESGRVDGLVAGASNTTADTIRPALQLIKTNPVYSLVSSIFFMLLPNQVVIYGDCAININPTSEELAEIAIQSANSAKIFNIEPRIAMLSYSTGYSGNGDQVEKVRKATDIVKIKRPDLIIDGPIQYDAAISNTVSKLKSPNSPILGSANIFIFPDLNSGNITYKAVQRSSELISIGPMLQGLRKPVNDLSRGASVQDIIYTIALTSAQSV